MPDDRPTQLGYNKLTAKPEAEVLVDCGDDPLLAAGRHGAGRSAAFVSDCAPHWPPPGFMDWQGYALLWGRPHPLAGRPVTHPVRSS